jgi:hypothetical protein
MARASEEEVGWPRPEGEGAGDKTAQQAQCSTNLAATSDLSNVGGLLVVP